MKNKRKSVFLVLQFLYFFRCQLDKCKEDVHRIKKCKSSFKLKTKIELSVCQDVARRRWFFDAKTPRIFGSQTLSDQWTIKNKTSKKGKINSIQILNLNKNLIWNLIIWNKLKQVLVMTSQKVYFLIKSTKFGLVLNNQK